MVVGRFSLITPSVQFFPPFLSRLPQVSIAAVAAICIVLLGHAALARPTSAAASAATGSIPKSADRLRLASEERLQLPIRQYVATATTTQVHRHLLVRGGAVGSRQNGDQAARALVGSSPPKCVKKCGACTPCRSVLVPIHTTNLPASPAEYYPEAWRCQCRGKIYNP